MNFDPTRPIWLQLLEEFQRLTANGSWPAGSRIPAVRELAEIYGANPNTVQRALAEFERLGLAVSQRTAGRFVTEDTSAIKNLQNHANQQWAQDFVARAQGLDLDLKQALSLLEQAWKENQK